MRRANNNSDGQRLFLFTFDYYLKIHTTALCTVAPRPDWPAQVCPLVRDTTNRWHATVSLVTERVAGGCTRGASCKYL